MHELSHEQLVEESAKLDERNKDGEPKDAPYLRDQLIYALADVEVEKRRDQQKETDKESYWTPTTEEWKGFYASAASKVDSLPAEQHRQKLIEVRTQREQVFSAQRESSDREETGRALGVLAGYFFKSMLHPIDLLFLILALSTAYRIGSHGFSKTAA